MINQTIYIIVVALISCFSGFQLSADGLKGDIPSHAENVQEIVHYARAYRKDLALSPEKETLRQQHILEEVGSRLKIYDAQSSLEDAVTVFVQQELTVDIDDLTIINANLTDLGGKSHDSVFLIKDQNGNLSYIVKAFRNPRDLSSKFLPEVSALDLIEQLAIPGVEAIKPIAFALCSNQEGEWGLLLETAAKGQRIDQFIYQLASLTPGSNERDVFFGHFQKVFRRMAESFAKLHAIKSSESFYLSTEDIDKYNKRLSEVQENSHILRELEERFPVDAFFLYAEKIKTNAIHVPLSHSYWHGDAHLGNMLYDDVEDIFYFIDVAKLHHSISITGEPLLDGTIDLVRIEESLRRLAIGLLSDHEVEELLKSFYEAYEEHSCQPVSPSVFLFHKTCKKLGRLVEYSRYMEMKDPIEQLLNRSVFESALNYFELQMESEINSMTTLL